MIARIAAAIRNPHGRVRVLPQKYWISKLPLVSPSLMWLPHHMAAPFSAAGESAGCWAEPTNDARILSASPCEISLSKVKRELAMPSGTVALDHDALDRGLRSCVGLRRWHGCRAERGGDDTNRHIPGSSLHG